MKKTKRIISCVMVTAIFLILTGFLVNLLERKTSYVEYSGFFEQEEDFDVLFMGTSHVRYGIFPMELWNDYGIVSFNLGKSGIRIPTAYWIMKNALDYTEPELVVIDCYSLSSDLKAGEKGGDMHIALDALPLSDNKINMVNDLYDNYPERLEYLFNYILYHNCWNILDKSRFVVGESAQRGSGFVYGCETPAEVTIAEKSEIIQEETAGIEYIRKMIEECQSRNIDVLLVYLPFNASAEYQIEANSVYDIAEQYGVNYINFLDTDIINLHTDLYDDTHLNPSGGKKVTEYLGQYMIDNYNIEDSRINADYDFWNEDYIEYVEFKKAKLKQQDSLDVYLMSLKDKNFSFVMEIKNGIDICENKKYAELFANLNISFEEILPEGDTIIVVTDGGESVEYYNKADKTTIEEWTSELGVLNIKENKSGNNSLYLDKQECWELQAAEKFDVTIAVVDNSDGKIFDEVTFLISDSSDIDR